MMNTMQLDVRSAEKLRLIYTTSKHGEWEDQSTEMALKTSWHCVGRVMNFTAIRNNTRIF